MVYCHAYFRNCTPTVQDVKTLPSLCTWLVEPVGHVHKGGVRIYTASVRKYRSSKSDLVSEVQCHTSFQNSTPTVRGVMGTPNLFGKAVRAPVRQRKSASCTDPYSGCTKISFATEFSCWGGILPCSISELYTYCTTHHRISQFVNEVCMGSRNAT